MQKETAMRLCKLAAEKTGYTIYVEQSVAYYARDYGNPHHSTGYRVTYFYSVDDCEGVNFENWTEAAEFLKRLALGGLPDVQEHNADAL